MRGDGFDDILVGAPGADAGGNDAGAAYLLFGRDFTGTVDYLGGDGHDTLIGSRSDEALNGGRGNDVLDGGGGADVLNGGSGDDMLSWRLADGGSGSDALRLDGDAGDTVFAAAGWTATPGGAIGIAAQSCTSYTFGAATLLIDTDIIQFVP